MGPQGGGHRRVLAPDAREVLLAPGQEERHAGLRGEGEGAELGRPARLVEHLRMNARQALFRIGGIEAEVERRADRQDGADRRDVEAAGGLHLVGLEADQGGEVAAGRMAADQQARRIAAIGCDFAGDPGEGVGDVGELAGHAAVRRLAIGDRDEHRRRADQARRHEAHPFLAAARPCPAVHEHEHRQPGEIARWHEDVEALPVVRAIGQVEMAAADPQRAPGQHRAALGVGIGLGVDHLGQGRQVFEGHRHSRFSAPPCGGARSHAVEV